MYLIRGLVSRPDADGMGGQGFYVDLPAIWRELVEASGVTQEHINRLIANEGRRWLDVTGYGGRIDDGAEYLYDPRFSLQVKWGEWGPEHINVPGNACGLDISFGQSASCIFDGGEQLLPHNVDAPSQRALLLIVFTEIASIVMTRARNAACGR